MPSLSPLTSIPSAAPSFVGLVVSIDISKPTTIELDTSEVFNLQNTVAQAYSIDAGDLTTSLGYVSTGTIGITISNDSSTEAALDLLSASLASILDVPKDVIELEFDAESSEVTYAISTADYIAAEALIDTLQNIEDIEIDSDLIQVSTINANTDIIAELSFIVNADDASTLQQSKNILDAVLGDAYALEAESNIFINSMER